MPDAMHAPTDLPLPDLGRPDALSQAVALVEEELAQVELELAQLLQSAVAMIPKVAGHLTFAGGKRFRPLVTLLSAKAAGTCMREAISLAAVGELLHTATLLHDDVTDNGDFRRGRPSARYQYGNGLAVLVGDFCLARALQATAALGKLSAVTALANAVTRMAEGEVAQLQVAGDSQMDRSRYYMVIDRKTSALVAWCSSLGGTCPEKWTQDLEQYGLELGYAFQIADDIIDYQYDVKTAGKSRGQDLREGKVTLPMLLACEADSKIRGELQELLRNSIRPLPEAQVDYLLARVSDSGALRSAQEIADKHASEAIACLAQLPDSPAKSALCDLANYVSNRST